MKVVEPSVKIVGYLDGIQLLKRLESIGRVCYKSEDKITDTSYAPFLRTLIKNGHESVLEHVNVTLDIVTDRGISHEIVRHRIASYSQESTRYCNYKNKDIEFICPVEFLDNRYQRSVWADACAQAEYYYKASLAAGASPQNARAMLPNCLKTEIVMTANLREWRHFLKLRLGRGAHPDMRALALLIVKELSNVFPIIFDDILEQYQEGTKNEIK